MYDPDNDNLGWPRLPIDVVQGGQQINAILAALEAGDATSAQQMLKSASPGIRRMIAGAMQGGGAVQSAANGLCPPIFEYTCGSDAPKEHRSPAIKQTRTFTLGANGPPVVVATSSAVSLISTILAALFSDNDSRKFFLPKDASDDTMRAKTLGRGLVGVGFEWTLNITTVTVPSAIYNGSAEVENPTTKIWTEQEIAPIIKTLNLCTAGIYKSASGEPHVNELEIGWYGREGKYLPRNLAKRCVWTDENAHIKISNPAAFPEVILPASSGAYYISGALTATGIFVDPDEMAHYFTRDKAVKK